MLKFPVAFALLFAASASAIAEDYEIKFSRPYTVGFKARETGRITQQEKAYILAGGQEQLVNDKNISATFTVDWKVLEMGKRGATKIETTVVKFHKLGDAVDTVLLEEGTKIISQLEKGKKVHKTEKGEVPGEVVGLLNALVSLEVEGTPDDDEVLGAKERKKIGDTWAFNSEAAVKGLAVHGMSVDEKDFKGECKLVSAGDKGGKKCLEILMTAKIAKVKSLGTNLPPGLKLLDGSVTITRRTWMPVDLSPISPSTSTQEEGSMKLEARQPDGANVTIRVDSVVKIDSSDEAVK